jgi:hypothetical protein
MENTVVCGLPLTHIAAPLKYEADWPSASSYGAEHKNQDGHLAAILEVGSQPISIGHLP